MGLQERKKKIECNDWEKDVVAGMGRYGRTLFTIQHNILFQMY